MKTLFYLLAIAATAAFGAAKLQGLAEEEFHARDARAAKASETPAIANGQNRGAAQVRLQEGFLVDGAEGMLEKDAAGSTWSFRPSSPIKLVKKEYPAGRPLPMLPCSVLEQMVQMAGDETTLHVRLWAMATQYRRENSLYAIFFMPLKAAEATSGQNGTPAEDPSAASEDSILPPEILRQMKNTAAPDLRRFQQVAQVTGDMNLIGRSGYLQRIGGKNLFVPDGFGQNIERWEFALLPSGAMETAEKEMDKMAGRQRYTVSGLVTTYKGQTYMLLRRAQRTFTNGNFTQ